MARPCTQALALILVLMSQHPVSLGEPEHPPYISSLIDAYAFGEVSGQTLARTCASATGASTDDDNIRIMRGQNKAFCDAYVAGIVEIATALHLKCESAPNAATIHRLAKDELARSSAVYGPDFAGAVLSRGFKCVR